MSRLVRLYPRPWRDRYEAEFLSLISDRQPTLSDRLDIVRGALDARLRPQVQGENDKPVEAPIPDNDVRNARRLGIAALIGAAFWPAAWGVAAIGPLTWDSEGGYRDGSAALPILIGAVSLLAAGLFGQLIRLPRNARVARGSAVLAIPCVLLYGMAPWSFSIGFVAACCLVVLALAGARSGLWPWVASIITVVGCFCVVAIASIAMATFGGDRMAGGTMMAVGYLCLIPVWLAVGGTLVRPSTSMGNPAG